jgi:hypothetical protein
MAFDEEFVRTYMFNVDTVVSSVEKPVVVLDTRKVEYVILAEEFSVNMYSLFVSRPMRSAPEPSMPRTTEPVLPMLAAVV